MKTTTGKWLMVAAIAVLSTGAMAQGRGNGNGKDRASANDQVLVQAEVNVEFSTQQRQDVSVYLHGARESDHNACPPGLAKKNNGCQPPGQAKRYHVGQRLPRDIAYEPVPHDIAVIIGVPPDGYTYGMIDGDLVKLVVGTLLVVDAIDGL